jgi:hypothetical protein
LNSGPTPQATPPIFFVVVVMSFFQDSVAGQWQRSLPSLAKELASETDSRDNKISTQVRFIREERKAVIRDG